ncbi:MAG TPA: hypothetical protein DCQ50_16745 [Chryseobacterium sp.]|nr:hypothetical protein [Chryseobacterium sp.]
MRIKYFTHFALGFLLLQSCANLQNAAKYELADGNYKLKIDAKSYKVYANNSPDSLLIHNLDSKSVKSLPNVSMINIPEKFLLIKPSIDVDVLTTLFKWRGEVIGILPMQMNANFNGNIYLGYRRDLYIIKYKRNAINEFNRKIDHIAFGAGLFGGLGNTALNPSTTNNKITTEYDGVVVQKGIAGIFGLNKLTVGIAIVFDNLIGIDRKYWIYQNKPWLGFMLGLNLN